MVISKRLFLFFTFVALLSQTKSNDDHHYTREWAVKVSDSYNADLIALETGFENKGLVDKFLIKKFIHKNYMSVYFSII